MLSTFSIRAFDILIIVFLNSPFAKLSAKSESDFDVCFICLCQKHRRFFLQYSPLNPGGAPGDKTHESVGSSLSPYSWGPQEFFTSVQLLVKVPSWFLPQLLFQASYDSLFSFVFPVFTVAVCPVASLL